VAFLAVRFLVPGHLNHPFRLVTKYFVTVSRGASFFPIGPVLKSGPESLRLSTFDSEIQFIHELAHGKRNVCKRGIKLI
jgi:hypothetical protein